MTIPQFGMLVFGNCVPALRRLNAQPDAAADLPVQVLTTHR